MDFVINGLAGWLRFRSIIVLLVYILASAEYASGARNEIRCGSIDIRNTPFYGATIVGNTGRSEIECTIVEGDFSLSMITEDGINNDMYPVFKDLREITGALLVFQVKGLTTLSKIFPNLRVIGGHSLIMNYALVIYQNQDLRNVGLTKLSVIKNGGVRIAENSRLCYTRNINWDNMIVGNLRDIILDTAESQCQDQCVVANESRCYQKRPGLISCWNASECQSFCQYYKHSNGSFGPGCTDSGEICHHHCLGGCTAPNDPGACHTCKSVEIHGICAEACPDTMFEQLNRRCLTKEQCYSLKPMTNAVSNREEAAWKAFMGKCHYDCPTGYKEDPDNPRNCQICPDHCPKKCKGDETVDSAGAAAKYRGCNIIDGSLEIEIRIGNEANVEKFAESFEDIEEITGYLMIRFSSVFVSLHMFKGLRIIHGNQLWRGNYALVVFDNQNLRELFNVKKQSLTISKGRVQFQNNRMLCYQKIVEFLKHIGKFQDVTEFDVSAHSNGEKAVCDEVPLEVEVTFVYSDGFSIRWTPFNTSDMDYRKFIGYQIFYKKVDKIDEDLSVDEDRSACADTWKMQFSDSIPSDVVPTDEHIKSHDGGALISQGIEANTIYAFYVQTRIVNHPGARNAISRIRFVRTHFGNPDPPRIRVYRAQGPDRIDLQWDPPLQPQGTITHYTVQWQPPEQSEQPVEINGCEEIKPPPQTLVSKKTVKAGTCSAKEGCCDCSLIQNYTKTDEEEALAQEYNEEIELNREERDAFENAIQNKVFVQNPKHVPGKSLRNKRHVHTIEETSMDPTLAMSIANKSETAFNISLVNVSDPSLPDDFYITGKLNITGNRLMLTGLPHFKEYVVLIYACQDINEPDNSCSARPAWVTVRTSAIPKNDRVNPETIQVLNATNGGGEYDRRFNWLPPDNPNGVILAYQVKLYRNDVTTAPLFRCINRTKFLEDDGITFSNLAGGTYTIEVRTVTLAGPSPPAIVKDIIYLYVPIMSKKTLFIVVIALSMLLILLTAVAYFIFRYYCKKIKEDKVHHLLSSNPEYLSQIDVYKKDEWELPREKISIGKEIGSGTFGKVYRGIGNNVVAVNGSTFGECAVKTISESNANMDRFHFLIEASVMKQFNTNFIVKLYGVVSDTPVLVIMELMEKGNLRDFLRAHRPGSEENAGSRYNLPTADQYYKWGAQIADGMAYLENVHADESVKIGDFGMARDIYYREYYKPQGRRLMPIRWLSPESLKDGKFTLKSDVWSFGVVLYEMLTLGQQPYAGKLF
ncbi:Receptor protein-tyrosine kinase [Aphelenchoides bicaudatus]|nr:Receptor protein-tyrosine kinase [Aphelenchoides bicaudatus]